MKACSLDLRERIVARYDEGDLTQQEVAEEFSVSLSLVEKLLRQRRLKGSIAPLGHAGGRTRVVSAEMEQKLREEVERQPDASLAELRETCGIPGCVNNVWRALQRLRLSLKKKTFKYAEQLKPEIAKERSDWQERQAEVDEKQAYFLDESAAKTNMTRLYGRSPIGQRVYDYTTDGRWHTYTMLGTLTLRGAGPMLTFSGGVNVPTLEAYVEQLLAPVLKPGDVVYMDNLSAHKHPDIKVAITRAGARLVLIPRYSPDFNPIELMWSKIKAYLRKVKARTEAELITAIGAALDTITAKDAANWFRHCGYGFPFTQ